MSGISGHVECFWCFCRYQRWHSPAQTVRVYMTASAQPTLHSAAVSSIWWTLLKDLVQFICSAELLSNEHYKSNLCLVSSTFLTPSTGP
jgi:hypothetical protein